MASDQTGSEAARPRIGYQGEPGAFGEGAANTYGRPIPFATFEQLLAAVRDHAVDGVVLPVENAVIGAVSEALVPLAEALGKGMALEGAGMVVVHIRLALAAAPGVSRASLRRARSHPAALRQCAGNLARLGLQPVPALDTAGAAFELAREVAADAPSAGTDAVVCAADAAARAGLSLVEPDISDKPPNATRFVLLKPALPAPALTSGETVSGLRARIDALDGTIAALLAQRLQVVRSLGALKRQGGIPTVDSARELEVRSALRAALPGRESLAEQLADLLITAGRAEQGGPPTRAG